MLDKSRFTYDPEEGILRWACKPSCNVKTGDVAGAPNGFGYLSVETGNKTYLVHRVVWEWYNGKIPEGFILDHVNCIRTDNRLANLRLVTKTENAWNRGLSSLSSTGVKGLWVLRDRKYIYWKAGVTVNKYRHIKRFPYTEAGRQQALVWLKTTRELLHKGYCNHG